MDEERFTSSISSIFSGGTSGCAALSADACERAMGQRAAFKSNFELRLTREEEPCAPHLLRDLKFPLRIEILGKRMMHRPIALGVSLNRDKLKESKYANGGNWTAETLKKIRL